jgi:hypothetical protein
MRKWIKLLKTPLQLFRIYTSMAGLCLTTVRKKKRLEIFKFNAQKNPQDKFTPNVGLARAYTAAGR